MRAHAQRCVLPLLSLVLLLSSGARAGVNVGDKPNFRFPTLDRKTITPQTYAGKIVVLDFWATWCGPCMAVADEMVQLNETYSPKGVQIVGISLDTNAQKMVQVAGQKKFTWPQVCDGGGWKSAYAKQFDVRSIPQTFIISPDGEVLWRGHPARLEAELKKALQSHPPTAGDPAAVAKELAGIQLAVGRGTGLDEAMTKLAAFDVESMADANVKRRAQTLQVMISRLVEGTDQRAKDLAAALEANPQAKAKLEAIKQRLAGPQTAEGAAGGEAVDPAKAEKLAAVRLNYAKTYQRAGKHALAVDILLEIASKYSQTDSAKTAAEMLDAYRADPATKSIVAEREAAVEAAALLAKAREYEMVGKLDDMRAVCETLLDKYADTDAAGEARKLLAAHPADAAE